MARKHGKSGQVLMDIGGSPGSPVGGSPYAPVAIADLNAWTLEMTRERVPVPAFGDTNIIRVTGLPDFSGTIGGWWNSASSPAFFGVVLGDDPVFLRLVPSTDEPTYYFQGLSNLDGSINVSATGAVAISGNWDAADNWEMNP